MPPDLWSGDFFRGGGTGLEQQRRRPPPAAETGSRGWGRVLIFQSPAKGLRKYQQTQPVQAPAVRFRQGSQRIGMSTKKDAARPLVWGLFSWWRYRTRTARAERSEGNQSPSGALISARFPTHRNVYQERCRQTHSSQVFLFWWTVQDENRDKQRQGITVVMVSCLLLILTVYGILGSVQQIGS